MDFDKQELLLERESEGSIGREKVIVKAARVIGADGINSKVRKAIEKHRALKVDMFPWHNEFRVLFAAPGAMLEGLDTKVHYIFGGCYAATVDNDGQQQWTLVMGARDSAPKEERKVLLSKNATSENILALKEIIKTKAPLIAPLFEDEEELKR